jgi:hypothetical protein
MKIRSLRTLATTLAAVCFLTVAAFAGDPTGNWTWTQPGRGGNPGRPAKLTLALKDGALTGTLSGHKGGTAIGDASFTGDMVAFSVTRPMGENTMTSKYSGKLDGDTITGTIVVPGRDGGDPRTIPWTATRAKAGDAPAAAPAAAPAPASST